MDNKKYTVTTAHKDGGYIEQFLIDTKLEETISRWVLDTSERQMVQALINLGWTPPKGHKIKRERR